MGLTFRNKRVIRAILGEIEKIEVIAPDVIS